MPSIAPISASAARRPSSRSVSTRSAAVAVGRAAGWVAHALEQVETGHLLRPRARYVGPEPVDEDEAR